MGKEWPGMAIALVAVAMLAASPSSAPAQDLVAPFHSPDAYPSADWRPFADSSAFNEPIAENPVVTERSQQIVSRLLSSGAVRSPLVSVADTPQDFHKPLYYATDGDPEFTVSGGSTTAPFNVDGQTLRMPLDARPAAGDDAHLTVLYNGLEYGFWRAEVDRDARVISVSAGRKIPIDGDGLDAAATASRFGNFAGRIRYQELEAGVIDHALFMTASVNANTFVYPARKSDGNEDAALDYPPMGTHFQLDPSYMTDERLAGYPPWKRAVLRALRDYGGFIGDSTSNSWTAMPLESGSGYTSFGLPDPFLTYAVVNDPFDDSISPVGTNYRFDLAGGVDWTKLRVIDTCATKCADLSVAIADQPEPTAIGATLTHTISVHNDGPLTATSVQLSTDIPDEATFMSATGPGTCALQSAQVGCELGTLEPGETASVEVSLRPDQDGTLYTSASAVADQAEPDPEDNSATEQTTVATVDSVAHEVPAGGTIRTGSAATAEDPIATIVSVAHDATVSVLERETESSAAGGFFLLSREAAVDLSPVAQSETPARLTFKLDGSLLPAVVTVWKLELFQDGQQVRSCGQPSGTASPDPCLERRIQGSGGDVELRALTTRGGVWTFGFRTVYARPGGGTPLRVPLVPAFARCLASEAQYLHAAPLEAPSCPPMPESPLLTTSSNGAGSGSVRLDAVVGDPGTAENEADMRIAARVGDVRCGLEFVGGCDPGAVDYAGPLSLEMDARVIDRGNGPAGVDGATVADQSIAVPIQCAATAGGEGSLCAVDTTLNAVAPGTVQEGRRSIWQLASLRVLDAGPDGNVGSGDEAPFQVAGVFAP